MIVAVDIKCLAKDNAGIARVTRTLLDTLQRIDHENTYLLFERRASGYVVHNPRWQVLAVPSRLPGTIWLLVRLPGLLRRLKVQVLWEPENILPGWLCPPGMRRVVTVHDLTVLHHAETMRLWNRIASRLFMRATIQNSHAIVAVSEFTRTDILRHYSLPQLGAKVVTVPNGKPDWRLPDGYRAQARGEHLLFVGSPEPRKNLLAVLRALAVLAGQGETVRLRLVGPRGWKNREIYECIKTHGLQPQVEQVGFCDGTQLIDQYCACKALIFPSLFEGFGLPVLEALVTDTLVITSRNTVMEEVGGKAVVLVDPHDPRDIAGKISHIMRPEFDRSRYLQFAPAVLERFDWERSARRMQEVFAT